MLAFNENDVIKTFYMTKRCSVEYKYYRARTNISFESWLDFLEEWRNALVVTSKEIPIEQLLSDTIEGSTAFKVAFDFYFKEIEVKEMTLFQVEKYGDRILLAGVGDSDDQG